MKFFTLMQTLTLCCSVTFLGAMDSNFCEETLELQTKTKELFAFIDAQKENETTLQERLRSLQEALRTIQMHLQAPAPQIIEREHASFRTELETIQRVIVPLVRHTKIEEIAPAINSIRSQLQSLSGRIDPHLKLLLARKRTHEPTNDDDDNRLLTNHKDKDSKCVIA